MNLLLEFSHLSPPLSQEVSLFSKKRRRTPPGFSDHPTNKTPLGLRKLVVLAHFKIRERLVKTLDEVIATLKEWSMENGSSQNKRDKRDNAITIRYLLCK